jgi:hypothetical protein
MKCCICTHEISVQPMTGWSGGHNAQPVMEGRCCDDCNNDTVLTRRMRNAIAGKDPYEGRGILATEGDA